MSLGHRKRDLGHQFKDDLAVEALVRSGLVNHSSSFYNDRIKNLPQRRAKCVLK